MKGFARPAALRPGNKIALLTPATVVKEEYLLGGEAAIRAHGYEPVRMPGFAVGADGRFAGSADTRLHDLLTALENPDIKAIWCGRGGYGAVQLISRVPLSLVAKSPKWLIGFSDITALHNLWQKEGFASLHAPMARHLTVEPEDDFCTQALRDILTGAAATPEGSFSYTCDAHKLNRRSTAEGILRGGNFAVFNGLRGTPYDIPTDGTVLFIEDVGERPHAIERMMYNLKLGGVLERLSGLVIGQFTEYEEKKQLGKELYGALADLVKEYDYPVCFNFPVGHVTMNLPLVCGAPVQLDVDKKGVRLTFQL